MSSLKITYVFASLFCVMVIFRQAEALICFECNSHNDTRCSQDIPPDVMQKNCDDHRDGTKYTMCRKITQIIEFEVNGLPPDSRVIRGCGWDESNYKGRCYQRSGFGGRQEVCSCLDDLCNGVGAATGSLITLAVGLVTLLVTRAAY